MGSYRKAVIVFNLLKKSLIEWSLVKPHEIYEAVLNKDHDRLKILLIFSNANKINSKEFDESPLDLAASQGDEISVELLLDYGAIPNYNQPLHFWSRSTLSRAILSGNHEVIQLLLNQGCDLDTNLQINRWQEIIVNSFPYNYWFKVLQLNYVPMFQLLLGSTGRTVGNDEWSRRILITACGLGSDAIVDYMLDQGVPIESKDESFWTCAFFALAYCRMSTLRLLAARGANFKQIDIKGRSLLHIAILYWAHKPTFDLIEIIRFLCNDNGVDINAIDFEGLTPIRLVLDHKNIAEIIVLYLLQLPNINCAIPDVSGITPLHSMINKPRSCFVEVLCNVEVDINARDITGRTPLHFYKNDSDFWTFRVLLGFGVDTSVLHSLRMDVLMNKDFLMILEQHRINRSLANFSRDPHIDTILAQHSKYSKEDLAEYKLKVSDEIQQMKETIICEKCTFYDFLHAKKRALVKIVQNPEMYELLVRNRLYHGLNNFKYMLIKNYVCGKRPLTATESQAITCAERNLDFLFNYEVPNLITYKLKKYLDIEDMVTLENMQCFSLSDNE